MKTGMLAPREEAWLMRNSIGETHAKHTLGVMVALTTTIISKDERSSLGKRDGVDFAPIHPRTAVSSVRETWLRD